MTVYFIGAGPGAPDLLTLRAARIIGSAPVCLYAGSIIPPEVLELCPEGATIINTARMDLSQITSHILQAVRAGQDVARLHSGDPSIYSAMHEQMRAIIAAYEEDPGDHDLEFEVIPGVPAYAAAAAALGQELTIPGQAQTVILTRINGRASAMPAGEELSSLAAHGTTLAIHLAAHDQKRISEELIPYYGAHCPVAVVAYASRDNEEVIRTTLDQLDADCGHIRRTAVIFVGPALAAGQDGDLGVSSFLYSHDRPRDAHGRTIPCSQ